MLWAKVPSKAVIFLFLTLAAVGVAVPQPVRADAPNPAQTLAVGDSWTYNFQATIIELTLTGALTQTIIQREQITVLGTTFDSFRLAASGSGTILAQSSGLIITGTWTASGDDYWRVSDQGDIKSHVAFQISAQVSSMGTSTPVTLTTIMDSENSPPQGGLQFPLFVGAHWGERTTTISNQTTYGSLFPTQTNVTTTTTTRNIDVSRNQVLAVDAGSFDTYLVRTSSPTGSADNYYSPEVETSVKTVSYNATGFPTATIVLASYNAWPYRSVVSVSNNGRTYNTVVETNVAASSLVADSRSLSFKVSGSDGVTGKATVWLPLAFNNTDVTATIDGKALATKISQNATQYEIELSFPLSSHLIRLTYGLASFQTAFLTQPWFPIVLGVAVAAVVILVVVLLLVTRRKPEPPPVVPSASPPPPSEPPPTFTPPENPPPQANP